MTGEGTLVSGAEPTWHGTNPPHNLQQPNFPPFTQPREHSQPAERCSELITRQGGVLASPPEGSGSWHRHTGGAGALKSTRAASGSRVASCSFISGDTSPATHVFTAGTTYCKRSTAGERNNSSLRTGEKPKRATVSY